ncbi:MAG: hypothetical protein KDD38_06775 [Bdellovibrionales bacterium]|nr:hypothetical protein [Bdellovibrionales bacterium]
MSADAGYGADAAFAIALRDDGVEFQPGTGIFHTFINNTDTNVSPI